MSDEECVKMKCYCVGVGVFFLMSLICLLFGYGFSAYSCSSLLHPKDLRFPPPIIVSVTLIHCESHCKSILALRAFLTGAISKGVILPKNCV